MREVKFRAWDKINKEWLVYKQKTVAWQHPIYKEAIPFKVWMYFSQDGKAFSELQYCIDSEDFEVVQFTGLKDSKGNEIYEGDIVSLCIYDNNSEIFIIEWVNSGFRFCDKAQSGYPMDIHGVHDIEIIGNIYENPELLEVKE